LLNHVKNGFWRKLNFHYNCSWVFFLCMNLSFMVVCWSVFLITICDLGFSYINFLFVVIFSKLRCFFFGWRTFLVSI
jgi:hypothetical protein